DALPTPPSGSPLTEAHQHRAERDTETARARIPCHLPRLPDLVVQLREAGAHLLHRDELEWRFRDGSREEGCAGAEGDGSDGNDQLVEQAPVPELSDELAATDEPSVLAVRGRGHLLRHGSD